MTSFETSPQASHLAMPRLRSPAGNQTTRPASATTTPKAAPPAGSQTAPDGHDQNDAQRAAAVGGAYTSPPTIHDAIPVRASSAGTQTPAAARQPARPTIPSPLPDQIDPGHSHLDPQTPSAGVADLPDGHSTGDTQADAAVGDQASPPTTSPSAPSLHASAGTQAPAATIAAASPSDPSSLSAQPDPGQATGDIHTRIAGVANIPDGQPMPDAHRVFAVGEHDQPTTRSPSTPTDTMSSAVDPPGPANRRSEPTVPPPALADPLLALAADVLDDLEKVKIANENRLRQLTRDEADKDGEIRGFGLDTSHPDVARLSALVDMLGQAEHQAELNLKRLMRQHPLGPWVKATVGIGEKQGARLFAAIGDPYIRPEIVREDGTVEPSRPRTVSELWAYTGYHVIPADHRNDDTQAEIAGGEQGGHPDQASCDAQDEFVGVAPKRQRGQHANWNATAKMRTFLVAESCVKATASPFRIVYDETRQKYDGAVHKVSCVRCGPSGNPAPTGSPLSPGHQHARALRAVSKAVLKELWREARRIHETTPAAMVQATPIIAPPPGSTPPEVIP